MSASMSAAVTAVPAIAIVPVTAGVRPTAVVEPMPLSSSFTRKPTNVPVEFSKLNSPTVSSTAQLPSMPLDAAATAGAVLTLPMLLFTVSVGSAAPVAGVASVPGGSVPAVVVCTALTAASRLTGGGASSRRNHQIP